MAILQPRNLPYAVDRVAWEQRWWLLMEVGLEAGWGSEGEVVVRDGSVNSSCVVWQA